MRYFNSNAKPENKNQFIALVLKVAIIPIHNDAHAQDDLIIYMLLLCIQNDHNRLGAQGGHELHHMLRRQPVNEHSGLNLAVDYATDRNGKTYPKYFEPDSSES